jgi:CelD/BcsL family acetyltransferase involved in cellulose biosynthesis
MGQVLEIRRLDELVRWRSLWDDLWRATPDRSLFQHFDWLVHYWQHFGQGQQMRVLVVLDGRPAIVPLVVRREQTRVGKLRVLTYPLHDWGSLYGPIGPDPQAGLAAALEHVQQSERDWEMLDLRWIPSGQLAGMTQAARSAGFSVRSGTWARTALVEFADGWEAYFARCSGKFRNHVRRCEKRAASLGKVVFERFRPTPSTGDDPRLDLYETCVALAAESWQGSSETGTTLSHASVAPFLRQVHVLATRLGMLDLNLLRIDGRPAAFAYNYCWDGNLLGVRAGYAPRFASAGVGHVLTAAMLRDSFARGDRVLDLGPLYFAAKQPWTTRVAPIHRLTHYPLAHPLVQVLRVKHWLCDAWAGMV